MNKGIRLRRRLNSLSTALIANILNLLLILIFKGILDAGVKSNGSYNMTYGVIELVVIVGFWIYFTYAAFKSSTDDDDNQVFGKYLLYSLLPTVIMAVLTTVIILKGHPGIRFLKVWNAFTFVVSPTLYLFLPFGVLSVWMGSRVPFIGFMFICIGVIAAAQAVGYAFGAQSRKVSETEEPQQAQPKPAAPKIKARRRRPDAGDPLSDVESPAVIETEAFSPITDEMIDKVLREERKKQRETQQQKRKSERSEKSKPTEKSDGPKWVSTDQKDISRRKKK